MIGGLEDRIDAARAERGASRRGLVGALALAAVATLPEVAKAMPSYNPAAATVLPSIAALRANISRAQAFHVASYYAGVPGGGGTFVPAGVNGTDNGGTLIVDAVGTRWVRQQPLGRFNVREFGAYGDGSHDDTAAVQACINTAQNYGTPTKGRAKIYFPAGLYLISSTITVTSSLVSIEGDGQYQSLLYSNSPTLSFMSISGPGTGAVPSITSLELRGLGFFRAVAPAIGSNCYGLLINWVQGLIIEDVLVQDSVFCFNQINSNTVRYRQCVASRAAAYQGSGDQFFGFNVQSSAAAGMYTTLFTDCEVYGLQNQGNSFFPDVSYGFNIQNSGDMRDVRFFNCNADSVQYGYYLNGNGLPTSGSTNNWDIEFIGCTSDSCGIANFTFLNFTGFSNINVIGGWANLAANTVTNNCFVLVSCQNFSIVGVKCWGVANAAKFPNAFYIASNVSQSRAIVIKGCVLHEAGMTLDYQASIQVQNIQIEGNLFLMNNASGYNGITLNNTSLVSISGNIFDARNGSWATGVRGLGSPNNTLLLGNSIATTFVTTPLTGLASGSYRASCNVGIADA